MMYEKLIKALLSASTVSTAWGKLMQDAAAAIEDLQRELSLAEIAADDNGRQVEELQVEVTELKRVNVELFEDLPKYVDKILHWVSVNERLPEPNVQCLVRDNDNNCAVGYYRQDVKAWDSPFFGWLERDDEYYEDGDLCRIGKVVAWMPIEPPQEDE